MKKHQWILGEDTLDEFYEYKNLRKILKNYVGSFSSNIDNIEKTCNKAGMIFSSHLDCRKVNPLIYVKFACLPSLFSACLPSLLFGTELFTFTQRLLLKLERYQSWFLRHIFHVPTFAPSLLLLKMSGLDSVAFKIASRKLLFLRRLITEPVVRNLSESRIESCFNANVISVGVMLSINEVLVKYNPFHYFES